MLQLFGAQFKSAADDLKGQPLTISQMLTFSAQSQLRNHVCIRVKQHLARAVSLPRSLVSRL